MSLMAQLMADGQWFTQEQSVTWSLNLHERPCLRISLDSLILFRLQGCLDKEVTRRCWRRCTSWRPGRAASNVPHADVQTYVVVCDAFGLFSAQGGLLCFFPSPSFCTAGSGPGTGLTYFLGRAAKHTRGSSPINQPPPWLCRVIEPRSAEPGQLCSRKFSNSLLETWSLSFRPPCRLAPPSSCMSMFPHPMILRQELDWNFTRKIYQKVIK